MPHTYVHIRIILYGGPLAQPKHFCISAFICKNCFFPRKNTNLDLNFKLVLVHCHTDSDLTRSAYKVTPINKITHGSFTLCYHLCSIDIIPLVLFLIFCYMDLTFLPTVFFTCLTYAYRHSVTSLSLYISLSPSAHLA